MRRGMPAAAFRAHLVVRFGDIDEAGFVYYPRLVHYFHVSMEEFFAGVLGVDYFHFISDHRLGLPTVRLEVDFHRPLHYGDRLEVEVGIEELGRTSIIWSYRIYRPGEEAPATEARLVTVNMSMETKRKTGLPDWLRAGLTDYMRRMAGEDASG